MTWLHFDTAGQENKVGRAQMGVFGNFTYAGFQRYWMDFKVFKPLFASEISCWFWSHQAVFFTNENPYNCIEVWTHVSWSVTTCYPIAQCFPENWECTCRWLFWKCTCNSYLVRTVQKKQITCFSCHQMMLQLGLSTENYHLRPKLCT